MPNRPLKTVKLLELLTKANRILGSRHGSYGREGRLAIASLIYELTEKHRIYLEKEDLDPEDNSVIKFILPSHLTGEPVILTDATEN